MDTETGRIDDPVIKKGLNLAPSHPENQKRIEFITDRLVYRFTHGRIRAATWHDEDTDTVWICAVAIRAEGDARDFYEHVKRLDGAGLLFPAEDDAHRQLVETTFSEIRAIREEAPSCLLDAEANPGQEREYELAGRIRIVLFVDRSGEDLEEIWLSVYSRDAENSFLSDEMKQIVFAAFALAAREAEWDAAWEWPTRRLEWYEVAKLGVRPKRA